LCKRRIGTGVTVSAIASVLSGHFDRDLVREGDGERGRRRERETEREGDGEI